MATMILLPESTSGHTFHWAAVGESTHHECLDDDNGDTSYVQCSSNFRSIDLGFANPSVAEADIDFTPSDYGEKSVSYDKHASDYETINGTARTTSDGSTAWSYANLENLSLRCTKNGTEQVRLSYLALEVTYVEAGYTNNVSGAAIATINGIATANISKINGV